MREHVPGRGDGHGGSALPNWYGCGIVDADKALIDNPPGGGGGGGTAPTAVDDAATTSEDTATDIAVLTNDTDADGGTRQSRLSPTRRTAPRP